jgi:multimeric flavodoxin WrbA
MITLIHASHRHGYNWLVSQKLKEQLVNQAADVDLIDLTSENIEYCCGTQHCQEASCIYKDDFTNHLFQPLLSSHCVFVITPTYFDMPPARLKNMIDRSNAVLPHINKEANRWFGIWASGETEDESILSNMEALKTYATILEMQVDDDLINVCVTHADNNELTEQDISSVSKIAKAILNKIEP